MAESTHDRVVRQLGDLLGKTTSPHRRTLIANALAALESPDQADRATLYEIARQLRREAADLIGAYARDLYITAADLIDHSATSPTR